MPRGTVVRSSALYRSLHLEQKGGFICVLPFFLNTVPRLTAVIDGVASGSRNGRIVTSGLDLLLQTLSPLQISRNLLLKDDTSVRRSRQARSPASTRAK